jgi:ferritin
MIQKKVEEAINRQVNTEIYSAYLYLSMSAYFNSAGLPGFSNWMELQAAEEFSHAKKFYDYIHERGGRVKLMPVDGPPTEWKSAVDVFEETLRHEQKITGLINDLVDLAIAEKDHATNRMLQWFVEEQVEEEATATGILDQLKLIEGSGNGMFMMDRELGQRSLNTAIFSGGTE